MDLDSWQAVFFWMERKRAAKANEASAGVAAQVANCLLAQYSRRVSWTDPVPSHYCHSTPAHDILMSCCCYRGSRSLQKHPENCKHHNDKKTMMPLNMLSQQLESQSGILWTQSGLEGDGDESITPIFVFCRYLLFLWFDGFGCWLSQQNAQWPKPRDDAKPLTEKCYTFEARQKQKVP